MPQRVNVPGVGLVEFPDMMPAHEVQAAVSKHQAGRARDASPAFQPLPRVGTPTSSGWPNLKQQLQSLQTAGMDAFDAVVSPGVPQYETIDRGPNAPTSPGLGRFTTSPKFAENAGMSVGGMIGPEAKTAEGFYSGIEKTLAQKGFQKGPKAQLENLLATGAKKEEMQYRGVADLLKGTPEGATLTRQQVADQMAAHPVAINEVVRGGTGAERLKVEHEKVQQSLRVTERLVGAAESDLKDAAREYAELNPKKMEPRDAWHIPDRIRRGEMQPSDLPPDLQPFGKELQRTQGLFVSATDAEAAAFKARDAGAAAPKFANYQLEGPKENYRELLMTLPEKASAFDPAKVEIKRHLRSQTQGGTSIWYDGKKVIEYGDDPALQSGGAYKQKPDDYWMDVARSLYDKGDRINRVPQQGTAFRGAHWDEPNVLAHLRLNDRVDADGKKMLFVEEAQSDWHQKARQARVTEAARIKKAEGISTAEAMKRVPEDFGYALPPERAATLQARRQELETIGHKATPEQKQEWAAVMNELQPHSTGRVPDAPFKKNWHELAMKRAIKEAVDGGYDRIGWTTGETQAARYDLSKQVSRVDYHPEDEMLLAFGLHGEKILDKHVEPGAIEDHVGKEVAKNLLDSELRDRDGTGRAVHSIDGEGLKVGGEGMKGAYDKMLPDFMNNYTKKWGGKVGPGAVTGSASGKQWVGPDVDLPSLRRLYESMDHPRAGIARRQQEYDQDKLARVIDLVEEDGVPFAEAMAQHGTDRLASVLDGSLETVPTRHDVHMLEITPAMRKAVQSEGQPLFALAPFGAAPAMKRANQQQDQKDPPPHRVHVPGLGVVEFPGMMPADEVGGHIRRHLGGK